MSANSKFPINGVITDITVAIIIRITIASNIPYIIPPSVLHCLIIGNLATMSVNTVNIFSKIFAIIYIIIIPATLTINFATLLETSDIASSFFSSTEFFILSFI